MQDQPNHKDGSIEVKDTEQEKNQETKSNEDCGLEVLLSVPLFFLLIHKGECKIHCSNFLHKMQHSLEIVCADYDVSDCF